MKVYLCGPINGCTDEECGDWRDYVTKTLINLGTGMITLDPMRRDYRGKENQHVKDIVELDKIDVVASDVILVTYDKPSVGTSMEILYAWERGKKIIVVAAPNVSISPWLRYHTHEITYSYDDAIKLIVNTKFDLAL